MAATTLDRLRTVAAASNLRSPLGRWFSAHHDEFEKLLRDYRPRWEALVEQFATDGLLTLPSEFHSSDKTIRQTTRRRVVKSTMRTWERVKAKALAAKKPPPKSAPVESTPPVARHAVATPVPEIDPEFEPTSRFASLKPAVARSRLPKPTEET